ncbi:gag/pol protein [Cucumis melo var. makuwa]|uniref:Gag/pol protein n=1 Tax=Cucumis melo var. makuwa TaxID=1194695 RepID=A0A5A7T8E8_CUCMM|nr:gag/pol protein [Cucumis melo var. makuwa]TYK03103.1 gag/pol protein [Cucumis melo var. makuwa]
MTKRSFTGKSLRAKTPLELVHSDLCGPMNVKARGGYKHFINFIDDYSRYDHVYLIQNKSGFFEKFKEYKAEVENESGKTIKTFRSDRGGEYMDLRFQDYLIKHGIQSQLSAPSTPQQNGVSERRNQTLLDMVRSMMSFAQLPDSFRGYALETTIYILNNVPFKSVSETHYELWKDRKSSLRHFRIWGCPAHVLVQNPKNLERRLKLCLFVGYPKESKGGLFYDPQENRPSSSTKVVDKTWNIGQTHPSQELGEPRRSGRVVRQPDRYLGLSEAQIIIPDDGIEDPLTFKQAMNDVDCDRWIKAMDLEMESMYSNSVWTLVDQPNDVKPIGCKWIYKRKRDQVGKVQTFKAQLVAKGYTQKEGMDNEETFSPVAMIKSIRILLSITTFYDYEIWQMDVKTTFLNGHLTDIKEWLATQFQMKDLGNAQYVLGIQIVRNRKNRTLAMSQTSYIDRMLSRYKMHNSKKGLLPYRYGIHLSKEQCPKTPQEVEDMSNIPYASTVGSLIRTKDYMLVYGSKDLILTGYIDSNFQTDKDGRKSTSGLVFTLNVGAVVWRSIKQSCIADSIMEAEYVATCEAIRKYGAVANSGEPRSHKRGKHIDRKYHHIRKIVHRGDVTVTKISSEQNMTDPFTKALTAKVFESHLHGLGLRDL